MKNLKRTITVAVLCLGVLLSMSVFSVYAGEADADLVFETMCALDELDIQYSIVQRADLPDSVVFVKAASFGLTGVVTNFGDLDIVLQTPGVDSAYIMNDVDMDYALTIDKDFTFIGLRGEQTIGSAIGYRHFYIAGGDVTLDLGNITLDGRGYGGLENNASSLAVLNGAIVNCFTQESGGAIWTADLESLTVTDTVFRDNGAATDGWYISDADDIAIHERNIHVPSYSEPFTEYAYNNYDISYEKGTSLFSGIKVVRTFEEIVSGLEAGCNEFWIANDIQFQHNLGIDRDLRLAAYEQESVTLTSPYIDRHIYINADQNVRLEMEGIVLQGHNDTEKNGGIEIFGGVSSKVEISGGMIENCSGNEGGGIFIASTGEVEISDCIIRNNYTLTSGGGMSISQSGDITLRGCELSGNKALVSGGAIHAYHQSRTISLYDCLISDNSAGTGGGMGIMAASYVDIYDSEFSGNTALNGGGISSDNSSLSINSSEFTANSAEESGGAIKFGTTTGHLLRLQGVTISENTAGTSGGGIYVDDIMNIIWGPYVFFSGNQPQDIFFESDSGAL